LDDGVSASFPNGVTFQRSFTGTPGTDTFALTDIDGNPVFPTIDPYFFSFQLDSPFPAYGVPTFQIPSFGESRAAGGWTSQNIHPRIVGDVNNDGLSDIVGFGTDGVHVALATGGGNFAAPYLASNQFGTSQEAGGWTNQDLYPRTIADVNGDGLADIIGFNSS